MSLYVSLSLFKLSLSELSPSSLSLSKLDCLYMGVKVRERETEHPLSQSLELSIGISFTTYANVPTWKKKGGGL